MREMAETRIFKDFVEQNCLDSFAPPTSGLLTSREINFYFA
jgi:hypothetical protein